MAARSRYSELPGIDNQPDVYETPDVMEKTNQEGDPSMQNGDESIHLLKIDAKEAFEKFSGKYLDPGNTDFSGRCGPEQMKGYVTKTEYEMLGEGAAKETPQNKFNRLQHEIRELAEELEQIKVSLCLWLRDLWLILEDLHLVNVLGKEALTVASTPQAGLSQRLQTQLEAFKTAEAASGKQTKQSDDGCVTYELFYKPEHAKFKSVVTLQSSITADLEIKDKNLLSVASALEAKVALLDANHIDHVDARLQGILHHVNALSEKKQEVENSAKQSKVTELYDLLNKWDSFVDVVPDLITRLQSLKALHEQASQFGQSLLELDSSQSALNSQMRGQAKLLSELEASFNSNVATIEANCERVEARINTLLEKFETKGR
ncbi:dynactin subunit 2-like [Pocillopora damicornis]|uniref:dynactin subunit 2-like n=1 Tax=Pocillopora damicornis TaxID=46731 RepID=UPI000F554487|nr:dynactin subunit 2-like [Pocillopora damicornis]